MDYPPDRMHALASKLDHTLLRADATRDDVDRLCREAREHGFAAVCVHGSRVAQAARNLSGSAVAVACVVGFPHGACGRRTKAFAAGAALEAGATELDCVIDLGALADGDDARVVDDLAGVVDRAAAEGALVKAILETGLQDAEGKERAARLAVEAGVAFVKTSTGCGPPGATVEDVRLLRGIVGPRLGVKASGGIRTREQALALVEAGADRLGTSSAPALIGGS